jgi:hypothetical protein
VGETVQQNEFSVGLSQVGLSLVEKGQTEKMVKHPGQPNGPTAQNCVLLAAVAVW